jgi:hypothetical protein
MLIETQIPPVTPIVDHGALTGLDGDDHPQYTPITDHGALTGRGDDDHTQYVLADGSRAMESCYVNSTIYCEDIVCVDSVTCVNIATGVNGGLTLADGGQITMESGMGELYWDNNRLRLNSNNTMIISSYYAIDIVSSDDVRILSEYTDVEISAPTGFVKISDLYAPDGIEFDTYGTENISSSTGDMFYSAYFGHTFESVDGDPLRSMSGYASRDGNAGLTTFANGMAFEDGLLVFVA